MFAWMESTVARARRMRWLHLAVVNLRLAIGFGFLPAATRKLLDQPFTDPANRGAFHEFLHAFHATGWFYGFVGAMQLTAAVLLLTQRFALLGAMVALPILTAIAAFCWSTGVYPTATVATLMWLGTVGLMTWDVARWRGIVVAAADGGDVREETLAPTAPGVDERPWAWCGAAILALFAGSVATHGGVYRPRGVELDQPGFYLLPACVLLPLITYAIARRRRAAT